MRPFLAVLAVALAIAVAALVADSVFLLLLSVGLLAVVAAGAFVLGWRRARQRDFVVRYIAIVAGGLGIAALAVAAIVIGSRDDAPGLVLLGSALITVAITGSFALGMRGTREVG